MWFRELDEYLDSIHQKDILNDPKRILKGDESGFALCPKTGKVLGPRGFKNLYQIKPRNEKENLTVLLKFNANGDMCPPCVVFPYIRPPKAVVNSMPIYYNSIIDFRANDVVVCSCGRGVYVHLFHM